MFLYYFYNSLIDLLLLRIVDLSRRNKHIATLILHVKIILKQFHIYLICDLQDIRKYILHMFHHSFCLTIFFTILLFYETLCTHILSHTLMLTYVCHYTWLIQCSTQNYTYLKTFLLTYLVSTQIRVVRDFGGRKHIIRIRRIIHYHKLIGIEASFVCIAKNTTTETALVKQME